MRIAKSITLDIGIWRNIDAIAQRERVPVSRVIENLIARGINQKVEEMNKELEETIKAKSGNNGS